MGKGKHVRSDDPRKPKIVKALKWQSGCTKVTMIREVGSGRFEGDCFARTASGTWELRGRWVACFDALGSFTGGARVAENFHREEA